MSSEFPEVFQQLRRILQRHAGEFVVSEDSATRYCLAAPVGPAMLSLWKGKRKSETIPVAWAEIGKSYVSFHHMALYSAAALQQGLSTGLKKRMQGKTCFNFRKTEEVPSAELEKLTARGLLGMKTAGFIE